MNNEIPKRTTKYTPEGNRSNQDALVELKMGSTSNKTSD
jgi:hypothetical protein